MSEVMMILSCLHILQAHTPGVRRRSTSHKSQLWYRWVSWWRVPVLVADVEAVYSDMIHAQHVIFLLKICDPPFSLFTFEKSARENRPGDGINWNFRHVDLRDKKRSPLNQVLLYGTCEQLRDKRAVASLPAVNQNTWLGDPVLSSTSLSTQLPFPETSQLWSSMQLLLHTRLEVHPTIVVLM
jgi:hypothetical protein